MRFTANTYNLMFILTILVSLVGCTYGSTPDGYLFSTKCNNSTRGQRQLYRNAVGDDRPVICLTKNGTYRWTFLDGSPTLGETFDPAKDCSEIVDNLPNAEDGFYWISTKKGKPAKAWCDVHTDGGGFMLVGMFDSPTTWSVPAHAKPVDPKGPPHWSSAFGDFPVLDLAVQVSNSSDFDGTKAHWSYRLNPVRSFGKLLTDSSESACNYYYPGIGNISYVKDIVTDAVVTKRFRCSKFTFTLGEWKRMNQCLQRGCRKGFAFREFLWSWQHYDKHGSFSYSKTTPSYPYDTTAFVGCDFGKCCACFGPKGGRNNYCRPSCTSINGGTVLKKAHVWFWLRSRIPKRVWKRCMQFQVKTDDGKVESYSVDTATGTARKGLCSKQLKTLMNEVTIVSSNKESLDSIPPVPGLLAYRSDIKQLYVNTGSDWKALSSKKEMQKLAGDLNSLAISLINLHKPRSCTDIKNLNLNLETGFYAINPQGNGFSPFSVYCDMKSKNGTGVTVIGHNSEKAIIVDGFHYRPGSYKRSITYDLTMDKIEAITKTSKYCEQFIKYKCHGAPITGYSWWVSRQGSKMNYWGGAAVNSGKCKCGMTNSCVGGGKCNCDASGRAWREDSGFLTNKKALPVTELRFGDTWGRFKFGYHTLGKLLCYG